MNRLKLALLVSFFLGSVGLAVYVWTRPQPSVPPPLPSYSAFTVEIDGEWIRIRNAGDEVLNRCSIDFVAELDSTVYTNYQGSRYYKQWEPGETQEIGISPPRGPVNVKSVRFTDLASVSDKDRPFRTLAYSVATPAE